MYSITKREEISYSGVNVLLVVICRSFFPFYFCSSPVCSACPPDTPWIYSLSVSVTFLCLVSLSSALTVLFLSPCHLSNQCLLSEAQGKSANLPKSETHSVGLNKPEKVCVGECENEGKGLSVLFIFTGSWGGEGISKVSSWRLWKCHCLVQEFRKWYIWN